MDWGHPRRGTLVRGWGARQASLSGWQSRVDFGQGLIVVYIFRSRMFPFLGRVLVGSASIRGRTSLILIVVVIIRDSGDAGKRGHIGRGQLRDFGPAIV